MKFLSIAASLILFGCTCPPNSLNNPYTKKLVLQEYGEFAARQLALDYANSQVEYTSLRQLPYTIDIPKYIPIIESDDRWIVPISIATMINEPTNRVETTTLAVYVYKHGQLYLETGGYPDIQSYGRAYHALHKAYEAVYPSQ